MPGAREMAQWVNTPTAPAENLGSIPSNTWLGLQLSQSLEDPSPSSDFCGLLPIYGINAYSHTHTLNNQLLKRSPLSKWPQIHLLFLTVNFIFM